MGGAQRVFFDVVSANAVYVNRRIIADYNGGHEGAPLAQDRLDRLGDRLAPVLLDPIRPAKLPVFLRSGKPLPYARPVVGEPSDFLLAGDRTAAVPEPLRHRLGRGSEHWLAHRRRHGIHVRSQRTFIHSPAQLVSRGHSSAAAVGHLAFGLRPPRMALPDADRLGGGSRQLFLASAVRRELGSGPLLPRATRYARPALPAGIPSRGPAGRVLSHPPAAAMVGPMWRLPAGGREEKIVKSPRFHQPFSVSEIADYNNNLCRQ